jgi:hypothetical protein
VAEPVAAVLFFMPLLIARFVSYRKKYLSNFIAIGLDSIADKPQYPSHEEKEPRDSIISRLNLGA